jgi:predicted Fe-Mo cluster-binding NifX family protein
MKVCITAMGVDLDCGLDPRFGRAACLLVVDTEGGDVQPLDGATGAPHGAGVEAAQAVIRAGAAAVVTGQIGPRAYDVLKAAGIQVFVTHSPTVADALTELAEGRLETLATATAPLHGGMAG